MTKLIHPMMMPTLPIRSKMHRTIMGPQSAIDSTQEMGWGFLGMEFGDPLADFNDAIAGMTEAIGDLVSGMMQTLEALITTVLEIIDRALNLIAWDKVFENLGTIVREISNIAVQLNPARNIYNFLAENPITRHTFMELDKFTGGMITSAVNVSDLVYRAARGDAISKQELLKDAIFVLQVVAIIYGGPMAAAALAAALVGKEACKNAGEAKTACEVAVTIAITAAAGYAADYYDISWGGTSVESLADNAGQSISSSATDTIVQAQENNLANLFAEEGVQSFSHYLSSAAAQVLETRVTQEITKQAVTLCQQGNWVGDRECAVIGQIATNYINSPVGTDWPTFLSQEAARLGVSLLMEQWFPENSPERRAIQWQIQYNNGKDVTIVTETKGKSNLKVAALVVAGATAMLYLGA